MPKYVAALFLASLPLFAQEAEAQKKFAGTWEAKFKDTVICTIRVTAGEQISGELAACSISIDGNGDLQESSLFGSNESSGLPVQHFAGKVSLCGLTGCFPFCCYFKSTGA
jgi:hypothetical protein